MSQVRDASVSERRTSTSLRGAGRLVGLDVARFLALFGMVTTHMLAERTPTGDLSLGHLIASGRASALFAVLAGVSLALLSGGRRPVTGGRWLRVALGVLVRAALIAGVGLWLGGLDSGIAVILTYYGVLFCLGLPFLPLRARPLVLLAAFWTVAAPVLSHLLRPELPERRFASPTFGQLSEPWLLLSEITFTGYYPVVPWLSYLLIGMALGRMDLRSPRLLATLAAVGGVLTVVTPLLSRWATSLPPVSEALRAPTGSGQQEFWQRIEGGLYGTTPTGGAWEWLLVGVPHSGTPVDLAATIGSALLVLGLCLLGVLGLARVRAVGAAELVRVLFGAGTMTLSLYTLHVVMRSPVFPPADTPSTYPLHLLVLGGIGAAFALLRLRGPLEWLVGLPGRWLRR